MNRPKFASFFLVSSIILLLIACGKKESAVSTATEVAKVESAQNQSLIKKLPANTLFYGFVDLENPKFQSLIASPFSKHSNILESFSGGLGESKKVDSMGLFNKILNKFQDKEEGNILSLYRQNQDRVSNYLFFISGDSVQDLAYNIFAYSKDKKYFQNNFEKISQDLLEVGLTADTSPNQQMLGATQKDFNISGKNTKLHLAVDENYLAISSSKNVSTRLFSKLDETSEFDLSANLAKELETNIASQPVAFAVANFEKILQLVPGVGLLEPKIKQLLNIIPRQALFTSDFDGAPESKLMFHLPETSLPAGLQGALKNGNIEAWKGFSATTFMAFDINLGFIKKVLSFVRTEVLTPNQVVQAKTLGEVINYLPDNGELGLAFTNFNITGFPDLQLSVPLKNAPEKVALLKSLITSQKDAGMGNLQWQEKQVADQLVEYLVTPFGVGLYVNTNGDMIKIGSSETALKELLTPSATLLSSLDPSLEFNPENVISSFYLDYSKLYRVAQSFKSMMAMFIPPDQDGQVQTVYKRLEELKNLVLFADTSYKNNILEFSVKFQTLKEVTPAPQG